MSAESLRRAGVSRTARGLLARRAREGENVALESVRREVADQVARNMRATSAEERAYIRQVVREQARAVEQAERMRRPDVRPTRSQIPTSDTVIAQGGADIRYTVQVIVTDEATGRREAVIVEVYSDRPLSGAEVDQLARGQLREQSQRSPGGRPLEGGDRLSVVRVDIIAVERAPRG